MKKQIIVYFIFLTMLVIARYSGPSVSYVAKSTDGSMQETLTPMALIHTSIQRNSKSTNDTHTKLEIPVITQPQAGSSAIAR
jgi:hypothetical protein